VNKNAMKGAILLAAGMVAFLVGHEDWGFWLCLFGLIFVLDD